MADINSQKKRIARKRRHKRIRRKISGTSDVPRMNIFRSLNHIYVQVIDDLAGTTLVSASTIDQEVAPQIKGKSKVDAAKVVGSVIAERAKNAGIKQVVFDRGGYQYHGRVAAIAEGAREAGLKL